MMLRSVLKGATAGAISWTRLDKLVRVNIHRDVPFVLGYHRVVERLAGEERRDDEKQDDEEEHSARPVLARAAHQCVRGAMPALVATFRIDGRERVSSKLARIVCALPS